MKHLTAYVAHQNFTRKLFKQPLLDVDNLSARDIRWLRDSIEGDLSPENLTCDGELSSTQVRKKYNMLMGAIKDLERLTLA